MEPKAGARKGRGSFSSDENKGQPKMDVWGFIFHSYFSSFLLILSSVRMKSYERIKLLLVCQHVKLVNYVCNKIRGEGGLSHGCY